ncbi:MAG TPA: sigma-70 family RNA polymerase sigma factor [Thiobacillaceae bacterium]
MWSEEFQNPETPESDEAKGARAEGRAEVEESETGRYDAELDAQDITQRYFEDISRLPVLKPDQEKYYARRMKDGDEEAREILITHNLRLVVYVAKRYLGRGLPLLDLVEEGNLGLMHALEKFDADRGFRLSTYALWWIRQSIERALMNQSRTVRLPVHVAKELNGCLRARSKLEGQGISDPGPEAIAAMTGKAVEDVRHVMQLNRPPVPLDAPLEIDSDLTLGEAIADEHCVPPEDRLYQAELEQYVSEWLSKLSAKQRWVIEHRFGFNNQDMATLEELARDLQVTRERVRQIQVEAQEVLASQLRQKGVLKENWHP